MRISGGKLKGQTWKVPSSLPIRPTTGLAIKGLMNILHHRYNPEGLRTLDLFCGTGQITFELASRGASQVVSVDKLFLSCRIVQENAMRWNLPVSVIKKGVMAFIKNYEGEPFDLIFADPPFDWEGYETLPGMIFEKKMLTKGGWFILEHDAKKDFSKFEFFIEQRKYGHVCFSIFNYHPHD